MPKPTYEELEAQVAQLIRQIEGMRAKEQEFKRFKSRYQDGLQHSLLCVNMADEAERVSRKLRRAAYEIVYADKDFRRKDMIDYMTKVLNGLGYDTP